MLALGPTSLGGNKAITTGTTLLLHLAAPDVAAGRGGMHAKDAHTVGTSSRDFEYMHPPAYLPRAPTITWNLCN